MANDISGINSGRSQQTGDRQVQGVKKAGTTEKGRHHDGGDTSAADKVTLTGTAAKLKEIEDNLSDQPSVDAARVKSMQDSIKAGEYRVNPDRVADKMLNFESAFDK